MGVGDGVDVGSVCGVAVGVGIRIMMRGVGVGLEEGVSVGSGVDVNGDEGVTSASVADVLDSMASTVIVQRPSAMTVK